MMPPSKKAQMARRAALRKAAEYFLLYQCSRKGEPFEEFSAVPADLKEDLLEQIREVEEDPAIKEKMETLERCLRSGCPMTADAYRQRVDELPNAFSKQIRIAGSSEVNRPPSRNEVCALQRAAKDRILRRHFIPDEKTFHVSDDTLRDEAAPWVAPWVAHFEKDPLFQAELQIMHDKLQDAARTGRGSGYVRCRTCMRHHWRLPTPAEVVAAKMQGGEILREAPAPAAPTPDQCRAEIEKLASMIQFGWQAATTQAGSGDQQQEEAEEEADFEWNLDWDIAF
jgi:hypothetical protein